MSDVPASTPTPTETLKGRCACGTVTYTLTLPTDTPRSTLLCHCTLCHRISGSAFTRNILVPTSSLIVSPSSLPYTKACNYRTAPASRAMSWTFCTECGSTLYSSPAALSGMTVIKVGLLERQKEWSRVQGQLWSAKSNVETCADVVGGVGAVQGNLEGLGDPEALREGDAGFGEV